jgi:uncharacterized protein (TIRG00374 family)
MQGQRPDQSGSVQVRRSTLGVMHRHRAATHHRRSRVPAGALAVLPVVPGSGASAGPVASSTAAAIRAGTARQAHLAVTACLLVSFAGLVLLAPRAVATSWTEVGRTLGTVGPLWWGPLAVVWLAGLWSHAAGVTACLPGLRTRQAMSLNLAGSAVANVLPLGGAVSFALTSAMTRSWGFTPSAITSFLLLTNLWNVLARLLVGCLATAWFLSTGIRGGLGMPLLIVSAALALAMLAVSAVLTSDKVLKLTATTATRLGERLRNRLQRATRPHADQALVQALMTLHRQVAVTVCTSWHRLTLGMSGYILLLALLLDLCLRGLGSPQSAMLIVATVGIERLVTALPLTPGGAGAAELSLVACLSAGGVSGALALAAALLYRIFTFFAEIPVGATVALAWHLRKIRHRTRADAGVVAARERAA